MSVIQDPMLDRLNQLRSDKSGATVLAEMAADVVDEFVTAQAPQEPREFSANLEALLGRVVLAQPSMAVMLDLVQRVLVCFRDDLPFPMMKQRVQEALAEFRREQCRSMEALCEQALTIFPSHATVLTYSNSATVTAALCHAHVHGHLDRVLLSEARPAFDGRPLARKLAEAGVAVEYSIDMGLFAGLAKADLTVFGADAIFPTHFLNKIGTHALAELAQARGIPCFSLCASNKFLPAAATRLLRILTHRADEIWPEAVRGVHVHNRYFEEVPLSVLRGVASDQGVHTPEAVRLMLQQRSLPAALQRLNIESNPQ